MAQVNATIRAIYCVRAEMQTDTGQRLHGVDTWTKSTFLRTVNPLALPF